MICCHASPGQEISVDLTTANHYTSLPSVAMAIADVFRKNATSVGNKFTKMLKIFVKIDEMKS